MRIIQVVGRSNSGKTTFIKTLIPELKKHGHVAVVKHLGHHDFLLEKGKDTTEFFDSGAEISVGIDGDKAVISLRETGLDVILRLLSSQKIDFVIVEGYKTRSFPRIVIGDLKTDNCVLINPSTHEVLESLDRFQNFDT
jgi:molybdopterin-guanine dinucleotide biosynthesis protein MobB